METEPRTEQPDAPPPAVEGDGTDPSFLFVAALWIPVFAVVTWGMMLLMGRRPWDFSPQSPRDPTRPPSSHPPEPGPPSDRGPE